MREPLALQGVPKLFLTIVHTNMAMDINPSLLRRFFLQESAKSVSVTAKGRGQRDLIFLLFFQQGEWFTSTVDL